LVGGGLSKQNSREEGHAGNHEVGTTWERGRPQKHLTTELKKKKAGKGGKRGQREPEEERKRALGKKTGECVVWESKRGSAKHNAGTAGISGREGKGSRDRKEPKTRRVGGSDIAWERGKASTLWKEKKYGGGPPRGGTSQKQMRRKGKSGETNKNTSHVKKKDVIQKNENNKEIRFRTMYRLGPTKVNILGEGPKRGAAQ